MSKGGSHSHRKTGPRTGMKSTTDGAVYFGLLMIAAFVLGLALLITGGVYWREMLVGLLLAIGYLVNFNAFRAYQGKKLANWQSALARLPMRCAGYGTKDGKPLEASAGQPKARSMLIMSIVVTVIVVVAAALLLVKDLRPW